MHKKCKVKSLEDAEGVIVGYTDKKEYGISSLTDQVYIECRIVPIIDKGMKPEQYPVAILHGTIFTGPNVFPIDRKDVCLIKFDNTNHIKAISIKNIKYMEDL